MDRKKILIVDDETEFVHMVRLRLEANGYSVIEAHNGVEGMKKVESEKPDLIILDVMMPEKDGYTMARELKVKDATKSIPVMIVTAKTGMKDSFEIEGISEYVIKPFDGDDLVRRIKKLLD